MAGRSEKYEPNEGDVVLVLTGMHFGRVCTLYKRGASGQTFWAHAKNGQILCLFVGEFIPHEVAKRTIEIQTGRGVLPSSYDLGFEFCGAVKDAGPCNHIDVVRCELPNHGGLHAAVVLGDVVVWRGARVRFRVHKTRDLMASCWDCEGVRGPRRFCASCGGRGVVRASHSVKWASDVEGKQNEERFGS